jgi:tRNA-splicing ligase RtcB
MLKILSENLRIPIKLWISNIENGALEQACNSANLPFAFHHISIMPDAHQGYGVPIGSVLATDRVVIPNAVGVDIGCGMCAVKTSLKAEQLDKETLKTIMGKIREAIPVGNDKDGRHAKKQDESLMPVPKNLGEYITTENLLIRDYPIVSQQYESALTQIGTLGGGNHFIEIQKDKEDNVWIMIHSGSRNLGHKVATHYNELAIKLNRMWCSCVPTEWELAFLPIETEEAKSYMREMQYCVDFALANRSLMMDRIIDVFEQILIGFGQNQVQNIIFSKAINIAHNYASWENHFGKNVIVHRKGATLARKDTIGIIPGSQGTKSYIVKGLGNVDSFMSCSHGAGRLMSRTKACNELNLEDEIKKLDDQGIVHGIRTKNDLDEASGAYKDIGEVMNNQVDLVEIITELQPLAVIKATTNKVTTKDVLEYSKSISNFLK